VIVGDVGDLTRVRIRSVRKAGVVVPKRVTGMRARVITLSPGEAVAWHSTQAREELLLILRGSVQLEVQTARRRVRRRRLTVGQCAFVRSHVLHRTVNRSSQPIRYLYVTAPSH